MSDRAEKVLKPFRDAEGYMKECVKSGIELNRKGTARLMFTDNDGQPVKSVHVELEQQNHDFRFGGNCFLIDEMESEDKNSEYKHLFSELFNLATVPFYWCDIEPEEGKLRFDKDSPKIYRRPAPDLCLEFCREHRIEPKLHCLNYDQWTPMWVNNEVQDVKRCLEKRFSEIADRYASKIPSMEVTNETLCNKIYKPEENRHSTKFFEEPDIVEWSFEHARKYLPYTKLIINEATQFIWGEGFHWNRAAYYQQIQRALLKGTTIDSIGMQYHMFYKEDQEAERTEKMYDPYLLYGTMDQYSDFGKPIQVTEVTIPAYSKLSEDEDIQAEIITNLYKIWFSHPNMEAVVYWNLVDGYAAFAPLGDMKFGENFLHGALVRFDMTPKPAYKSLKKLIHEEWHTKEKLDGISCVDFRGFYGDYRAKVTTDGRTRDIDFHLSKGNRNDFKFTV